MKHFVKSQPDRNAPLAHEIFQTWGQNWDTKIKLLINIKIYIYTFFYGPAAKILKYA